MGHMDVNQGAGVPTPPIPPLQGGGGNFVYPDARQKELKIRPFDGKELYQGLGPGLLEWGRRFERQIVLAQSACGYFWPDDV